MGSSLDLWPKLRRRIVESKTRKSKSKLQSYASQGVEKFSVVYAELQARRDSIVERIGTPGSMVRSLSKARNRSVVPKNSQVTVVSNLRCEGSVPSSSCTDAFSKVDASESDTTIVGDVDSVRVESDSVTNESVEETTDFDESAEGLEFVLQREISLKGGFGGLELRGRKGLRSRRRISCGRERRWRQVNRTVATFVVILGVMAEKSANVAGSILAALLLGAVSPCRRGKQHLCRLLSDIIKHLQGHLRAYLSGLASKRLDFGCSLAEEEKERVGEASSPCRTMPRENFCCIPPECSAEASQSPQGFVVSNDLPSVVEVPRNRETSFPTMSNGSSPTTHVERCLSPSNKLNQFKTKMLKSFSQTKYASDFRAQRASSMPPISAGCESFPESPGSHSERWSPDIATRVEDSGISSISPPDPVLKKKSFLQRRSMLRNADEGADASDIRCSRSRFGNLRISISHSRDEFGTSSPAPDSSRSLRIGSLRISTSMKESPRRSVDFSIKRPCSPGEWKQRASTNTVEGLRPDHATPRPSGLSVAAELAERSVREMKKRHKYEAFFVVVFLVALLFLIVGRAPAVVATSISLMFLSQLDKFQQSGGAGWDSDVSRRSMSISRKLRTSESTYFSPRSASPRIPFKGGSYSSTSTPTSNECRRSICMGQFFGRNKRS